MLDHIKRYIGLGFVVHPLCPPDHVCQSPGKIPFDVINGRHMTGWQHHEQFTLDQWQEWLDYDSSINVGFLTGEPSELVCLDIDDNEGMALLEQLDIPWRDTWQYRTGRGLRVLYRHRGAGPTGIITRGSASVEVLGDGRQSVLPPSVHPNGSGYRWVVGNSPRDCGLSERTDWLGHLGSNERGGLDGLNSDERNDWAGILAAPPSAGGRNNWFTSLAGRLLSPGGLSPEEVDFWLRTYNRTHLQEPLGDGELRAIVRSVSGSERRARESGERDIRRLMVEHGLSRTNAEEMWRGMVE